MPLSEPDPLEPGEPDRSLDPPVVASSNFGLLGLGPCSPSRPLKQASSRTGASWRRRMMSSWCSKDRQTS